MVTRFVTRLTTLHQRCDDGATARQHFLAALDGYQRAGRKRGASQAQLGLGRVASLQGDRAQALRCLGAALEGFQDLDDAHGVAQAQLAMGQTLMEDEPSRAIPLLKGALDSFLALEDPLDIANAHNAAQGRFAEAMAAARSARELLEASGQTRLVLEVDEWLTKAEGAVASVPCPCGSGAPFARCHGLVD